MVALFYIAGFIAIMSTVCAVLYCSNPIHALLCLVLSLLSIACIFFVLRAPFAGVIEVIVYAGAIMILFAFVIMMLDMNLIFFRDNRSDAFISLQL